MSDRLDINLEFVIESKIFIQKKKILGVIRGQISVRSFTFPAEYKTFNGVAHFKNILKWNNY